MGPFATGPVNLECQSTLPLVALNPMKFPIGSPVNNTLPAVVRTPKFPPPRPGYSWAHLTVPVLYSFTINEPAK